LRYLAHFYTISGKNDTLFGENDTLFDVTNMFSRTYDIAEGLGQKLEIGNVLEIEDLKLEIRGWRLDSIVNQILFFKLRILTRRSGEHKD